MFNKTYITERGHTEYVPYEKEVTIKRAPTDESVKLLKEFEEKASGKIAETYFVQSSLVEGVVLKTFDNPTDFGKHFILIFKINGKQHTVKHNIKEWHSYHLDSEPTPANVFGDVVREYLLREILSGIKVSRQYP